ncbi:MAG: ABC transporter substrate-binding protein [Rhodospirillaceae bacterium]|nr:ABC transporter substrate-binding protein [Rhodospirillaceae bacterium]MBT5456549.1 ABC transporter substrate-binding protein [Rhodospirillaceae bacterium]
MRIAAVDLVSNTCFPALAADELGFFKEEGVDARIELVSAMGSTRALREGSADAMIAGSVFDVLTEFTDWKEAKICVALSQGTPWLLTVRADLAVERGDVKSLRGLRFTAAEGPDLVFKQMLRSGGLDPENDLEIIELPGAKERDVSFGVFAAQGLQEGKIDGFWANAMGAETAVTSRIGKIHVDVRRGDDPGDIRFATFAGLATTDDYLAREPEAIDAAVRAIVKAQKALRADPSLAREVGNRIFPSESAALIAAIVERDAQFYDPAITEEAVLRLNSFAQSVGQLSGPVSYDQVVASRCCPLWTGV